MKTLILHLICIILAIIGSALIIIHSNIWVFVGVFIFIGANNGSERLNTIKTITYIKNKLL
jgi:hypothetical protein